MNVVLYTLSVQVKTIELYCHSAVCGTKCHALQDDHMYHENNKQQK